jgi:hypothetical protein
LNRTSDGSAVNCKNYTASVAKKYFTDKNVVFLAIFSVGNDGILNVDYKNYSEYGV